MLIDLHPSVLSVNIFVSWALVLFACRYGITEWISTLAHVFSVTAVLVPDVSNQQHHLLAVFRNAMFLIAAE
jgi:hypothetical protein